MCFQMKTASTHSSITGYITQHWQISHTLILSFSIWNLLLEADSHICTLSLNCCKKFFPFVSMLCFVHVILQNLIAIASFFHIYPEFHPKGKNGTNSIMVLWIQEETFKVEWRHHNISILLALPPFWCLSIASVSSIRLQVVDVWKSPRRL